MEAITVNDYGAAPALTTMPTPEPGPGQILLRMRAAGVNPMDQMLASGDWRPLPATFPMVLGADGEGVVQALGDGATRFEPGDEIFGQLLVSPIGSAGSYAEYAAVAEDAPLARVPEGLDPDVAAAIPTAGGTALQMVESLRSLRDKSVLIVGAGGGVGSFATQFAAVEGADVIANAHEAAAERLRGYGAVHVIDHMSAALTDAVPAVAPDGIDVLIDVASGAEEFAALAALVRPGGTAVTTRYVADPEMLAKAGVTGINFAADISEDLLERVADAIVTGLIDPPPITRIALESVPALMNGGEHRHADGKTVIHLQA